MAGADDTLSKAMSMKQLISAMAQLARVAVSRAIVAAGKGTDANNAKSEQNR